MRTVPEYVAGHPKSALNVPVVIPNPATGQMTPNPEFLPTVEANLPKDAKIIVGCMSGERSQLAAELLERAGYRTFPTCTCRAALVVSVNPWGVWWYGGGEMQVYRWSWETGVQPAYEALLKVKG